MEHPSTREGVGAWGSLPTVPQQPQLAFNLIFKCYTYLPSLSKVYFSKKYLLKVKYMVLVRRHFLSGNGSSHGEVNDIFLFLRKMLICLLN